MKLKLGFEQAKSIQEYQIIASVVSRAFGGKSEAKEPDNVQQAFAQFESIFGSKRT